jgi:4-aminobutyrate aminotransferase-like enzyme
MVSDRNSREPLSRQQMRHLGSLLVEQGVVTGYSGRFGQVLKLRPPLVFSKSDADRAIAAIDVALARLAS